MTCRGCVVGFLVEINSRNRQYINVLLFWKFQSVYSSLRATILAVSFELLHMDGSYSLATLLTINQCLV